MITIKKGLDLPIKGNPKQEISEEKHVKTVALLGSDYSGMKPTMLVSVGDSVKLGQKLFLDKKNPGVVFTSPGAGKVIEINRGKRRVFLSLVIELEGNEEETFQSWAKPELNKIDRKKVQEILIESGVWTSIKTRPFSKSPALDSVPHSIFINAMDTNPLAADPTILIKEKNDLFIAGINILSRLTDGNLYCCTAPDIKIGNLEQTKAEQHQFNGPHPAGLSGTHIHFLDPVNIDKTVWSINYQDVIAIGHLFTTGKILVDRLISIAGPEAKNPRLIKTRIGANVNELIQDETSGKTNRIVSGSLFSGHKADQALAYLGRFHHQLCILEEGTQRELLGWVAPGSDKFSVKNVFLSALMPKKKFAFTTSSGGNKRAMVPIGMYEKVMPLDIIPTFLLRSLIVEDTDQAQQLGCLELEEEDLGLCTFVCPGKYDYGTILRNNLTIIEREG
jgi:Na+-transporting NADH:ubiquinone oxidoreductase subunit A